MCGYIYEFNDAYVYKKKTLTTEQYQPGTGVMVYMTRIIIEKERLHITGRFCGGLYTSELVIATRTRRPTFFFVCVCGRTEDHTVVVYTLEHVTGLDGGLYARGIRRHLDFTSQLIHLHQRHGDVGDQTRRIVVDVVIRATRSQL